MKKAFLYVIGYNYYSGLFIGLLGLVIFGVAYADGDVSDMVIGMLLFYFGWRESGQCRNDKGSVLSGIGHTLAWVLGWAVIAVLIGLIGSVL